MNRESERKRLVELIGKRRQICKNANCGLCGYASFGGYPQCQDKKLANILLDNGIIVPPVKVGQKLYMIADGLYWETEVIRVVIRQGEGVDPCIVFVRKHGDIKAILDIWNDLGRTVFTSREEARQAMKGSAGE